MLWHCRKDPGIPSGCSRWTAHPVAHYKPLGRGELSRMKTWRHFSDTVLCPPFSLFLRGQLCLPPVICQGWCLKSRSWKWAQGYKWKSCSYFCLLLLFNISSPRVCKLMKNQHLCFQQCCSVYFLGMDWSAPVLPLFPYSTMRHSRQANGFRWKSHLNVLGNIY